MNSSILHLALREMQVFSRSVRFWMTFGAVACLFTITGPFGTLERMSLLPRFGFWLLIHAVTWSVAILCVVFANILLRDRIDSLFVRMLIGGGLASAPIGLSVSLIELSVMNEALSWAGLAGDVAYALPLTLVFCVLTWMAMNREMEGLADPPSAPTDGVQESRDAHAPPPLLDRLKPELRGTILRLSAEDHYTRIETTRGKTLVLVRFADALKELGSADGLQVHRSHWVARGHVASLRRDNGKLALLLNDGSHLPVSRSHARSVRQSFEQIANRTPPLKEKAATDQGTGSD